MKRKKNMTAEEWRDLARGTDKKRKAEYLESHGVFSTDGFRAHLDESLPTCGCEFCNQAMPFVNAKHTSRQFNITTLALVTASKQAVAIGKSPFGARDDYLPPLVLRANGHLEYEATCEGNGKTYGSFGEGDTIRIKPSIEKRGKRGATYEVKIENEVVKYNHAGEETEFAINPNFLLDALSGMGESVTVSGYRNNPVVITDGTRKAVITPVNIR